MPSPGPYLSLDMWERGWWGGRTRQFLLLTFRTSLPLRAGQLRVLTGILSRKKVIAALGTPTLRPTLTALREESSCEQAWPSSGPGAQGAVLVQGPARSRRAEEGASQSRAPCDHGCKGALARRPPPMPLQPWHPVCLWRRAFWAPVCSLGRRGSLKTMPFFGCV